MTAQQRQRKLAKLEKIHVQLSAEANNPNLNYQDRMGLAKAADSLRWAIQDMKTEVN